MKVVILKIGCVALILVVMAITYVALESAGKKGIRMFQNSIVRWILTFAIGILLALLVVPVIFS